jgi:hypothetical protein
MSIYVVSEHAVTEQFEPNQETFVLSPRYPWKIEMYHSSGGLMKRWYLGANNVPIRKIKFKESEKGVLNGTIEFVRIDFPIYIQNEIRIYYKEKIKYRGYVENIPDEKGGQIKIAPYRKRLKEIRHNEEFTAQTFPQILQSIIEDHDQDTGVFYNASAVNFNSTTEYTVSYKYEKISKIINDYYEEEDDVYEGVDANGFQYIRKRETSVSKTLWSGQGQKFGSIDVAKDYTKIRETRLHIYQKSTDESGENKFIATIPDGTGPYPYLDLETETGIRESKWTAPDGLNSTQAKDLAFAKLDAIRVPTNVKIKDIDLSQEELRIGQKIRVFDHPEFRLKTIINCDTTDNWTGTLSLDEDTKVIGDASITWNSDDIIYYQFDEVQHYRKIDKLTMMIRTGTPGQFLQVGTGRPTAPSRAASTEYWSYAAWCSSAWSGLESTSADIDYHEVYLLSPNSWNLIEVETTLNFDSIYLAPIPGTTLSSTLFVDDIKIYGYLNNYYEGNVIKLDYSLDKKNQTLYNAEIGDFDPLANDMLFDMERRVSELESVNSTA